MEISTPITSCSYEGTEEKENRRILLELSDTLRRELPSLESASRAVEELDFIVPKFRFSSGLTAYSRIPDDEGPEALD